MVLNKNVLQYFISLEPELPELSASGDEDGDKTSTNGAEAVTEGDDLVMERVPSPNSRAAEEASTVREGSQATDVPQTNPETGEVIAFAVEGAEGGVEEGEEHQATPPLPRTVSLSFNFFFAVNNIEHCKLWSGAQNNPRFGQHPNPCRMEPPQWPAVSTSELPPQRRDKQNKIRQHKLGQKSH